MPSVEITLVQSVTFELIACLGRGGMAEVWRAWRRRPGLVDEVCIKRLHAGHGGDEVRALREEARILARLRHPNIVALLDVLELDGAPLLVLECVRGVDVRALGRRLEAHGVVAPAALAVVVLRDVARALVTSHAAPGGLVVHRDLSPHNVLVSSSGRVLVADFGAARAEDRERWTALGLIKGKLPYLSPEQLRDEHVGGASDVFSLGVLAYELLAGRRPFEGRSPQEIALSICAGPRPRLCPRAPSAAPELLELIEALLAIDPQARPTPREIEAVANELGADAAAPSVGELARVALYGSPRPARAAELHAHA